MKQYDTNERMMYLNEIRISIEIENEDYSKHDLMYGGRIKLEKDLSDYREQRRIESEQRRTAQKKKHYDFDR